MSSDSQIHQNSTPSAARQKSQTSSSMNSGHGTDFVEVERKFLLPEHCEPRILELGGRLRGSETFADSYYDQDQTYRLTCSDHWLRKRDDVFQFKYPPPRGEEVKTGTSTQYTETERHEEIMQVLQTVLGPESAGNVAGTNENTGHKSSTNETKGHSELTNGTEGHSASTTHNTDDKSSTNESRAFDMNGQLSLDAFLGRHDVTPFCTFTTTRKSYDIEGLRIDLDCADFGYSLGEIELTVDSRAKVKDALQQIEEMADKLGVTSKQKIPGKVIAYLKKFKPELLEKLLTANPSWREKTKILDDLLSR